MNQKRTLTAVVYLTRLQQNSCQHYHLTLASALTPGTEGGVSTSPPHIDLLTDGVTSVFSVLLFSSFSGATVSRVERSTHDAIC